MLANIIQQLWKPLYYEMDRSYNEHIITFIVIHFIITILLLQTVVVCYLNIWEHYMEGYRSDILIVTSQKAGRRLGEVNSNIWACGEVKRTAKVFCVYICEMCKAEWLFTLWRSSSIGISGWFNLIFILFFFFITNQYISCKWYWQGELMNI